MTNQSIQIPKALKRFIKKIYRPVRPTSEFLTIGEVCDLAGASLPPTLKRDRGKAIGGVETRFAQIREGDVFFDVHEDAGTMAEADFSKCLFVVSSKALDPAMFPVPVVQVSDVLQGYVRVCARMIDLNEKVIRVGVGGSSGKTSMKEMIASVVHSKVPVCRSFANSNNIFGLSKQIGRIQPKHECYVQEVGLMGDGRGWLTEAMGDILRPHIAVITNIGDNHSESYGSRRGIYDCKIKLADAVIDGGLVLLNKDDALLSGYTSDKEVLFYSLEDQKADIFAFDIATEEDGLHFGISYCGEIVPSVHLKMYGRHNIYNVLAAFAVARYLGIQNEDIVAAIAKYRQNDATRQNHIKIGQNRLLLDCFNSSPESVKYALKAISEIKLVDGARRIAVLGDIAELGERTELLHEEMGASITKAQADILVCFGPLSKHTYEAAKGHGIEAYHAIEREEVEVVLRSIINPGDLILWKASHSGHLELSVDNLFGTDYYTLYPVEGAGEGREARQGALTYKLYSNGAKVTAYEGSEKQIEIPAVVEELSVRTVGKSVFRAKNIREVKLPKGLVHIGKYAFYKSKLEEAVIPETVKYVGEEAFCGCLSLRRVEIRSNGYIGANAFNGCRALTDVAVLGNPFIEESAFRFCPNAIVRCSRNTRVAEVAELCGLTVVYTD